MPRVRALFVPALLIVLAALVGASPAAGQVKVIFDTDYESDVDDVGALAVLHALADLGEVQILGTISCALNPWSAPAVDAVNTYYGRGSIAIGNVKGAGVNVSSSYAQYLAEHFPQDTISGNSAPDAVRMYREILASQADASVVIMTVGYATNLRNLLASGPDEFSPLTGAQLVAQKVTKWVNMGGNFESRPGMDSTNNNWTRDTGAAVTAIRTWPAEIVFNGREIGHSMAAGARLTTTPADNPVRVAYEKYFGGTAKDRHLADLSTVLYAVRGTSHGADTYWLQDYGQITIADNASFTWASGATGVRTESRLVDAVTAPAAGLMSLATLQELIEDLMIAPPAGPDLTPPSAPTALAGIAGTKPGGVALSWNAAVENDLGSWVAGYSVLRDGVPLGLAYGTQFFDSVPTPAEYLYSVSAFNASGAIGAPTQLSFLSLTGSSTGGGGGTGTVGPYSPDAHTLHLWHLDESPGAADPGTPLADAALAGALAFTNTGGPDGRNNTGAGGYGAAAATGFGSAIDVLDTGAGTYHTSTSASGGGFLTASAVPQSALQGADGAFTYEALICISDTAGEQQILSHDGDGTNRGFLFRVIGGALVFYNGSSNYSAAIPAAGDHAFEADEWFHVAVTYSGEAGEAGNLVFYWTLLDSGVLEANDIGSATLPADLANVSNILGAGTTTRGPFRYELKGLIDEIRISDVARAPGEFVFTPEPATLALLALGGLGVLARRRAA